MVSMVQILIENCNVQRSSCTRVLRSTYALFSLLFIASFVSNCAIASSLSANKQAAFIEKMVSKHQFNEHYLTELFSQATPNQAILESIAKPWEAKPWFKYYPIFLTEKRLNKGLEFWQQYQTELAEVEKQTGVPAQIIVSIIGVETFYGSYLGKYTVFDALQTLAFNYPPRSTFFTSELEHLFLLAREEQFDITSLMGSYAGAMGWGQFIPSSYRAYAVDFDKDGQRDLLNNPLDAIASIANYFKRHGWQAGKPIAYPASVKGSQYNSLLSTSLKLKHTWQQVQDAGVGLSTESSPEFPADTSVKLIEFELEQGKEYWLVFGNFYSITRYNHSPLYAMVVYQLSEQLVAAKQPNTKENAVN